MIRRRASLAAPALPIPAQAKARQTWPSRPVRVIVPAAPAVGGEAIARPCAAKPREAFGRPFPAWKNPALE
ncbi:hypothetical protein [Elioraea sp.]|jgi:tripartite-type tricarboxylate transporter receptor subunit TctC|uniref:hypothetical protein n=1 Tax=Elioraea sp. TaxID=2185103 RepID=UPI0021DE485C|nr:hypothetical protein [Elioraea sp.]GIX10255.1 MAG: hypothetical protein KatS3mg116_1965 [Elioraea sp.]